MPPTFASRIRAAYIAAEQKYEVTYRYGESNKNITVDLE